MSTVAEKIKEEARAMIPPTVFFFVTLHLVALFRVLMLKGTGIALQTSAQVTIAALILGKAVLIADMLPFINRFPEKPLAYNISWKTAIYVLISMAVHYLERLFEAWRETHDVAATNQKLLSEIVWPHFWAIQILLLVVIFMYCTLREFVRVIGADRTRRMLFGPMDKGLPA